MVRGAFDGLPRVRLATLPTPLERGPELPGGARLWVKRDDLTGLGAGGNKARKLEFLCGEAQAAGARSLVTVGAGQSNHCRMTAAAGAVLGLETHLVLAGQRSSSPTGNQLLAEMFGAHLHFTGVGESEWGSLEIAREALTDELIEQGVSPHSIPMGGSTAAGALGYVAAFEETMDQCAAAGFQPHAIVVTSSSGGTHAGLVAGRARRQAEGHLVPDIVAIGVAKGVVLGQPPIATLARDALRLLGSGARALDAVRDDDIVVDGRFMGDDYATPTPAGDDAVRWAAQHGGWVLDRTYTGKGFSGLLGLAAEGRWPAGADVVFVHTGGMPALFAPGGAPDLGRSAAMGASQP
jgi:1-aminocyclopropane-1-carboxylate deaminase/D-cysteine desulfhydrase-like pyridoxal-dependent ACC family enzyme